jgi:hypothetical protein
MRSFAAAHNQYLTPPDDDEGPCEVCGLAVDNCICPECPVCGAQGDADCYDEPGLSRKFGVQHYHLKLSKAQQASRARARIAEFKERIQDEEIFLAQLEGNDDESANRE